MLAGPRPARNLLETCSLASLKTCVCAWSCRFVQSPPCQQVPKRLVRVHEPHWPDLSSVTWPVLVVYVNMVDIAEKVVAACCSFPDKGCGKREQQRLAVGHGNVRFISIHQALSNVATLRRGRCGHCCMARRCYSSAAAAAAAAADAVVYRQFD